MSSQYNNSYYRSTIVQYDVVLYYNTLVEKNKTLNILR